MTTRLRKVLYVEDRVVGVDQHGDIWQSTQDAANSTTYSPWTQIDGQLRP